MINWNIDKLNELLRNFYELTGIKISCLDNDGNELAYYPEKYCELCRYIRTDAVVNARCVECDMHAFSVCRRTHAPYSYVCHAGFTECITPILHDDNIIGFIMFGQTKNPDDSDFSSIAGRLKNFAFDFDHIHALYDDMPLHRKESINAAIFFLNMCADHIYIDNHVTVDLSTLGDSISAYIHENLTQKLNVNTLCRQFFLSRREIYRLFNTCFRTSVADYIKQCRLNKACRLLKTTSLPVYAIASRVGMSDYNYFTKVFKREVGITPVQYRTSNT